MSGVYPRLIKRITCQIISSGGNRLLGTDVEQLNTKSYVDLETACLERPSIICNTKSENNIAISM